MKLLKRLFLLLLILCIVGLLVWKFYPQFSVENKEAASSLPSSELFEAYSANETAANAQYLGKVVQVTGSILEKGKDRQGNATLLLGSGDIPYVFVNLIDTQSISDYERGQQIEVKGICTGMLTEVVLNKGVIIE